MARPPREHLLGTDRISDETGDNDLPSGLPRVDESRLHFRRVEPVLYQNATIAATEAEAPSVLSSRLYSLQRSELSSPHMDPVMPDHPIQANPALADAVDPLSHPSAQASGFRFPEIQTSQYDAIGDELRTVHDGATISQVPPVAPEMSYDDAYANDPTRKRLSLFKPKLHAANVSVSPEANRAERRKRQSRLYEDIIAWIVVPPFIIGAIYGGLELAKFLENSPLGKLISGQ